MSSFSTFRTLFYKTRFSPFIIANRNHRIEESNFYKLSNSCKVKSHFFFYSIYQIHNILKSDFNNFKHFNFELKTPKNHIFHSPSVSNKEKSRFILKIFDYEKSYFTPKASKLTITFYANLES